MNGGSDGETNLKVARGSYFQVISHSAVIKDEFDMQDFFDAFQSKYPMVRALLL